MAIQNHPEDRRLIVGGLDKFNACRPGKADRCVKRVLGRPSAIIPLDLRQCQKEEGARPDPRPSCRGGFQVMCYMTNLRDAALGRRQDRHCRSEARREGKDGGRTGGSWWSPYN